MIISVYLLFTFSFFFIPLLLFQQFFCARLELRCQVFRGRSDGLGFFGFEEVYVARSFQCGLSARIDGLWRSGGKIERTMLGFDILGGEYEAAVELDISLKIVSQASKDIRYRMIP